MVYNAKRNRLATALAQRAGVSYPEALRRVIVEFEQGPNADTPLIQALDREYWAAKGRGR